jgi:hypothetical protein
MDETSLLEIGILNAQHRKIMAGTALKLEVPWPRSIQPDDMPVSVGEWLEDLHLDRYVDSFRKNMYIHPDRLLRLCNDELVTLLEIELVGHRRRILLASSKITKPQHQAIGSSSSSGPTTTTTSFICGASRGYSTNCSSSSTRFENGLGMESELGDDDGSLPLRDANSLVSGVSSALKTAWRHAPETLIDGSVTYKAIVSLTGSEEHLC